MVLENKNKWNLKLNEKRVGPFCCVIAIFSSISFQAPILAICGPNRITNGNKTVSELKQCLKL